MRRAATLVELLVALTLAGLVLGTASRSVLMQQRSSRRLASAASSDAQSRAASDLLRSQLSLVAPKAGDFSGEQSDTALQLRAPVALGAVCASSAGSAVISVDDREEAPTGATMSPPRAGDSLWWYPDGKASWVGQRLSNASAGDDDCPPLHTVSAPSLRVRLSAADTLPLGAPVRITRQIRYDIYHGSDGRWSLGGRDWNDATHAFAPPQPIAGPFVRQAPNGERTGFRFFDADEMELGVGGGSFDVARIARIRLTLFSRLTSAPPFGDDVRRDMLEIALRGHEAR
jgi:type II secretory pathway pseudopilin PulG